MSMDVEVETVAPRSPFLTRIEPATFRGVDCNVLAERYVAYRRSSGLDTVTEDPDVIRPAPSASSENV